MQFNKWKQDALSGFRDKWANENKPLKNNSLGEMVQPRTVLSLLEYWCTVRRPRLSLETKVLHYRSCLFRWHCETRIHPVSSFKNMATNWKQSPCSAKPKPKGLPAASQASPAHLEHALVWENNGRVVSPLSFFLCPPNYSTGLFSSSKGLF